MACTLPLLFPHVAFIIVGVITILSGWLMVTVAVAEQLGADETVTV
jgi:hypothetical protein